MEIHKKYIFQCLISIVIMLMIFISIMVAVDPYFHYHAPLEGLEYPLKDRNERYQNDGIVKHFEYNAIITGTSMTENFKTSEFDERFEVNSIKVPFAGAYYKEINDNLCRAVDNNGNIKYILRGLDYNKIIADKDEVSYSAYPIYLYDDKLYNDVYYLLNKEVFLGDTISVIQYTFEGKTSTTFDEYGSWYWAYDEEERGKEAVLQSYQRTEKENSKALTEAERVMVEENVWQNIVEIAKDNPEIQFYYFFTPYSIVSFDMLNQEGKLERQLEAEKIAIELILPYDNIHLFSFFDEFNMDNYREAGYYLENVNSQIIEWMYNGEHELTQDNYQEYYQRIYEFYSTYNYEQLFEDVN